MIAYRTHLRRPCQVSLLPRTTARTIFVTRNWSVRTLSSVSCERLLVSYTVTDLIYPTMSVYESVIRYRLYIYLQFIRMIYIFSLLVSRPTLTHPRLTACLFHLINFVLYRWTTKSYCIYFCFRLIYVHMHLFHVTIN